MIMTMIVKCLRIPARCKREMQKVIFPKKSVDADKKSFVRSSSSLHPMQFTDVQFAEVFTFLSVAKIFYALNISLNNILKITSGSSISGATGRK